MKATSRLMASSCTLLAQWEVEINYRIFHDLAAKHFPNTLSFEVPA